MGRKTVLLLAALLFGLTGCDDFSLLDQFSLFNRLGLTPQKEKILQGETVGLNPEGGETPYSFSVIAEDLFYSGSLGSVGGENYTAGNAIGKVKIRLTDAAGGTAETVITVVPPAPAYLTLDNTVSKTITLTWNFYYSQGVEGVHIMRSLNGGTFAEHTTLPNGSYTYTDTGLAPNSTYTYYLVAAAGAYPSAPSGQMSALAKP